MKPRIGGGAGRGRRNRRRVRRRRPPRRGGGPTRPPVAGGRDRGGGRAWRSNRGGGPGGGGGANASRGERPPIFKPLKGRIGIPEIRRRSVRRRRRRGASKPREWRGAGAGAPRLLIPGSRPGRQSRRESRHRRVDPPGAGVVRQVRHVLPGTEYGQDGGAGMVVRIGHATTGPQVQGRQHR